MRDFGQNCTTSLCSKLSMNMQLLGYTVEFSAGSVQIGYATRVTGPWGTPGILLNDSFAPLIVRTYFIFKYIYV